MTLAELLTIIQAVKALIDIYEELKAKGLAPGDKIPAEHLAAVSAAKAAVTMPGHTLATERFADDWVDT